MKQNMNEWRDKKYDKWKKKQNMTTKSLRESMKTGEL